ncbi:hypothetical protein L4C42_09395 [Vibrio wakamikoensis]|jgi:hypothetical protein|uniref:Uncharacterized protein n=1 Tax=Vibrio chaetopteri TaxID=3016528 RepID=A0AAU8BI56_9VIBR
MTLLSAAPNAATIVVEPGFNTLRAAVANASAGDVLELRDGIYPSTASDLTIDKSLTIRAINRAANPMVYFDYNDGLLISGSETEFILQGVNLGKNDRLNDFKIEGDVESVALLENAMTRVEASVVQVTDSDNNIATVDHLLVVGNSVFNVLGHGSFYNWGAEKTLLFAGNKLNYINITFANFGAEHNVIGNVFTITDSQINFQSTEYARIIGNQFIQNVSKSLGGSITGASIGYVAMLYGAGEFVNNIIRQGLNPFSATGTPGNFRTLYLNGEWEVVNNVFEQSYDSLNEGVSTYHDSFDISGSGLFSNNIIKGLIQPNLFDFTDSQAQNHFLISHNLCFETKQNCPEGNGNQSGKDPMFLTDYQLATGSPAIDAGVDSNVYRDIDGSRADLGAYGGVYPIDQFTKQLSPGVTSPFFYPLFEANSSLSNTGALTVKAVAVARQR